MGKVTGKSAGKSSGGQYNSPSGRVVAVHGGRKVAAKGRGGHQAIEHCIKPRTIKSH